MPARALALVLGAVVLGLGGTLVREQRDWSEVDGRLDQLQRQVGRLEERVGRLEQTQRDEGQRAQRVRAAVDALTGAVQRLQRGDADVSEALDFAEPVLSAHAAWSIRAAREALGRKDLGLAQQHLIDAVAQTRLEPSPLGVR